MFKISQLCDGIIKVEDAFPVRLADNRLMGPSVHAFWPQRTAPGADRALRALTPRPEEEALR
jgi:hypothetical protein